jgi:hypothetical protein
MNIITTRAARQSLSLPNILTYARIAAIPVVVGCIYAQAIMDGPLWLRWVAVAVFIAAGITDFLDGYYARIWHQRAGDKTREMEDHGAAGRDRIFARGRGRRSNCAGRDPDRIAAAVDFGDHHHLYRLGLFPRRCPSPHRGG